MREGLLLEEEIETVKEWILVEHKPGEIRQIGNVIFIANSTGGLNAAHYSSGSVQVVEIESVSVNDRTISYSTIDNTYKVRMITLADIEERRKRWEENRSFPCCCVDFRS